MLLENTKIKIVCENFYFLTIHFSLKHVFLWPNQKASHISGCPTFQDLVYNLLKRRGCSACGPSGFWPRVWPQMRLRVCLRKILWGALNLLPREQIENSRNFPREQFHHFGAKIRIMHFLKLSMWSPSLPKLGPLRVLDYFSRNSFVKILGVAPRRPCRRGKHFLICW